MPRTRRPRRSTPMLAAPERMTAAQLLSYRDPADRRAELVRGRLMVSEPTGWEHGAVVARISFALSHWLREATPPGSTPVGEVVAGDAGFWIARDPDTVRAPDVAFVAADLLPAGRLRGFLEHAPSLAVEVVSPTDRPGAVLAKVSDWLEGGATLVWTVDPERREGRVYRADGSHATIRDDAAFDGEALLPGFVLALAEVLR